MAMSQVHHSIDITCEWIWGPSHPHSHEGKTWRLLHGGTACPVMGIQDTMDERNCTVGLPVTRHCQPEWISSSLPVESGSIRYLQDSSSFFALLKSLGYAQGKFVAQVRSAYLHGHVPGWSLQAHPFVNKLAEAWPQTGAGYVGWIWNDLDMFGFFLNMLIYVDHFGIFCLDISWLKDIKRLPVKSC